MSNRIALYTVALVALIAPLLAATGLFGQSAAFAQPVRVDPECLKAPVFAHLPLDPVLVSPGQYFVSTGGIGELVINVIKPDGGSFQILARRDESSEVVDGFIAAIPPNLPEGLYLMEWVFYPEQKDGCPVGDTRFYRIVH